VQYHQKAYLDGFLHPIMACYGPGETQPRNKAHIHADFFIRFNSAVAHHETMGVGLELWISEKVPEMTKKDVALGSILIQFSAVSVGNLPAGGAVNNINNRAL